MAIINFNGLATGLDTGSMIDQLVAVERSRATVYQGRIIELTRQGTIVDALTAKLATLRDRARGVDSVGELTASTATASDDKHATVAVARASAGSHRLRVGELALAQPVTSLP